MIYTQSSAQIELNSKIDSLIKTSIQNKNFPGAQLYVKIKDSIIINRSYGFHTYDSIIAVKNTHLYDLASLTKVLASTFSIMRLYDNGQLDLNEKLSFYFKELKNSNKRNTTLYESLSHTSGWIPYISHQNFIKKRNGKIKRSIVRDVKSKRFSTQINEELFLKTNNLNSESIFAIFLPNTYEFYWNTNADQFRNKMLDQYNLYWNSSRKEKAKSLNLSPVEVSVLASIVQRETPKVDERPTISGVYYNRLKKSMKLQADPTVVYTIKEKKGFDKKIRRVLYRDLKIKSPYNTYINKGLPPGPIYMSDFSSIESVLNLENNDYLFFVADVKRPGYHIFAKTYRQHNKNKRQYTNWLRKKNIRR